MRSSQESSALGKLHNDSARGAKIGAEHLCVGETGALSLDRIGVLLKTMPTRASERVYHRAKI